MTERRCSWRCSDKKEDLTRALINRENGVIITIGNENKEEAMQDCSLITATYHVDGKLMGKIGVIGADANAVRRGNIDRGISDRQYQ